MGLISRAVSPRKAREQNQTPKYKKRAVAFLTSSTIFSLKLRGFGMVSVLIVIEAF
jgi:hypothetical protein